ncbi:MAG: hypothetical protein WB383_08455 [Acidimicrobiales bacterium]
MVDGSAWSSEKSDTDRLEAIPSFLGAGVVSTVFKCASWIVIFVGVIGTFGLIAFMHSNAWSDRGVLVVSLGTVLGAALIAASFAFFAYVLDLLRSIAHDTKAATSERRR